MLPQLLLNAGSYSGAWLLCLLAVALSLVYVRLNDAKLTTLSKEANSISPHRWTDDEIRKCHDELVNSPQCLLEGKLPPKTGRRYIVVGGVSGVATRFCLQAH